MEAKIDKGAPPGVPPRASDAGENIELRVSKLDVLKAKVDTLTDECNSLRAEYNTVKAMHDNRLKAVYDTLEGRLRKQRLIQEGEVGEKTQKES